jgi:hypothetical protein
MTTTTTPTNATSTSDGNSTDDFLSARSGGASGGDTELEQ